MFKRNSVGRLGFFLGTLVLAGACGVGAIGDTPEAPGRDVGFDDAALTCPGVSADVSTSDGWQSKEASQPAPDALYFEVMARPGAANLDALVAVGAQDIHDFSDAAITVRFSESGLVDVMDDVEYSSDGLFEYGPGVWYNIAISADVIARTYDVEMGRCGEKRRNVIRGARFRSAANVYDRLSTWGVWSSRLASLELSTPTWMASGTCAPATCETLGSECGQRSDGCNGTLNCGVCGGGQFCSSGACVDEPVSVPPPPTCAPASCQSLGGECGAPSDGCDGTLNCGTCGAGQLCSNNVCLDQPVTPPSPPPACVPTSCQALGAECGARSNGCGGTLNCGGCGAGQMCSNSLCIDNPAPPPPPPGGDPSGPADSCPIGSALSGACICGGSVYSTGFCCEEGFSFSSCSTEARYVRPGGGGAQDGSDWANAWSGLPSVLERDTVYWLGAGNYGSYTFDDGASGQQGITLRKATAQAHGSGTGWNAAYGSGQAVFGPLRFVSGRYTLDGGEPNGLRTVGQMGTNITVDIVGSHVVLRHVEVDGGFRKSGGTQTAGACNGSNVDGDYVVFDRCEVHNIADDGLGIYGDHIKVLYSKIHDLDGCGTDGGCGPCFNGHSDGMEVSGVTDLELVGNMVYDVRSNAALWLDNWSGSDVYDLVVYNNVFYTPETGFAVGLQELHGAKVHNNIIWGMTQGSRYGGLSLGQGVTDLEMTNNIILNINYSHMGASYDPSQHGLDYNLFGMIDSGEYAANGHELVGDPQFAGIPMSSNAGDHKGSNLTLEDFMTAASQVIDTGTAPAGMPAYDIVGEARPQGGAWDRGPIESLP